MKKLLLSAILLYVFCVSYSQSAINGVIVDDKRQGLSFVNVVLMHRDMSFIKGTITNNQGNFNLPLQDKGDYILKISLVGYKTLYINCPSEVKDTIMMQSDAHLLNEVTVNASKKIYTHARGKIVASIENSVLARMGNAEDVLSQLPLVINNNGEFKILGKGTPQIYIDDRLIENREELYRLKSNEIKSIEIITTPGVEYDSSITSVIKIETIRSKNRNFSDNIQLEGIVGERFSEHFNNNIKYTSKKWEYYAESDITNYRGYYKRNTLYQIDNINKSTLYSGNVKKKELSGDLGLGLNYIFNENNYCGVRYNWTRTPYKCEDRHSTIYENNIESKLNAFYRNGLYRNYINGYYFGKLKKWKVEIDADYVTGKGYNTSNVDDYIISDSIHSIKYNTTDDYKLFTNRTLFKKSISNNIITIGGDFSNTIRNNNQNVLSDNDKNDDLNSSIIKNTQLLWALFSDYNLKWRNFYCDIGLRYEHTIFNYYENKTKILNQSKKYNQLMPTITMGYEGKRANIELGYKKYIQRPTYKDLSNSFIYTSSSVIWSGNPFLVPSITSEYNFNFSVNNFSISAELDRIKNLICDVNDLYANSSNIVLLHPQNLPSHNEYTAEASYDCSIGIYHPSIDVCMQFQNLKYGSPYINYNKPCSEFLMKNEFNFTDDFMTVVNIGYRTKGNYATLYTSGYKNLDISIIKMLMNKNLIIKFEGNDLLNKYREHMSLYTNGIKMYDFSKGDTRKFCFSVSYFFNRKKDNHKEGKDVSGEIKRL
jgi:hypothetical protein